MNDLMFDHSKLDIVEAMGVKVIDLKKFLLDVEEYMKDRKVGPSSVPVEFIWASDQSFEMKILSTYFMGAMLLRGGSPTIVMGTLNDLPESLKKKLRDDGIIP